MPPVVQYDDVTITGFTDPAAWVAGAAGAPLDLDTARCAADALLAYREQRTAYERSRLAGRGAPPPLRSSVGPLRVDG